MNPSLRVGADPQFFHLLKESPQRIPAMVTLIFILSANVLLLGLATRHALTIHPELLSWELLSSLFHFRVSHVFPLKVAD
jgi:hypothetical protein